MGHIIGFWAALAAFTVAFWMLSRKSKRNHNGLPLPPGPKGVPVFGNMFQIGSGKSWEAYRRWGETYGDIVYLEVMGEPILALNSLQACRDLLEKRAPNFSDRKLNVALDMVDIARWDYALFNYGPWWRANRRVFHQYFNNAQIPKYHPVIEYHTSIFLRQVAARPQDACALVKYLFGSIIMQISYGVKDPKYTESLIDDAEAIIGGFGEVSVPGRFLVDVLPFLRHVPSWLPGAGWKRHLDALATKSRDVYQRTFDDAKDRLRSGIRGDHPSVAELLIDKMPLEDDPSRGVQEELARNAILVAYIAGADTSASSGQALLLALAMYPKVQQAAQSELERVIGPLRIPTPADLSRLPYIAAIVKEVSRWHSVTPLALPHMVKEDEEYQGYFIPKGTTVFGNSWAIMHDPQVYEDPMEFKPERFMKDGKLDATVLDPDAAAFGFGRRICPGRHLSNATLPYMVACLLAVFNITPSKDAQGNEIPLRYDTGPDIVPKPLPFDCDIVARSAEHLSLVSDA